MRMTIMTMRAMSTTTRIAILAPLEGHIEHTNC